MSGRNCSLQRLDKAKGACVLRRRAEGWASLFLFFFFFFSPPSYRTYYVTCVGRSVHRAAYISGCVLCCHVKPCRSFQGSGSHAADYLGSLLIMCLKMHNPDSFVYIFISKKWLQAAHDTVHLVTFPIITGGLAI